MHPQILLLGIAATTVSAIDGYFHQGDNCDGPSVVCRNMAPGTCCRISRSKTIAYRGIPTDQTITVVGTWGDSCRNGVRRTVRNTETICLTPPPGREPFTGTRYELDSKKRAEGLLACPGSADNGNSKSCVSPQKPDELVLADGSKYNIAALEDDVVSEMVYYLHIPG